MRRREFVELLFLAAIGWPPAASAQASPRIWRIAVLMPYGEGETSSSIRSAFEQALGDLGWIDGQNVQIEYRLAGGDFGRLRSLARDAVELRPDVIVALNTPLVAALLDETRSIPVVFGLVSDPVGSGFAQSYARPGGNATGFAYGGSGLASKWLELLKEISPAIVRVAVLFHPDAAPGGGAYYLHPFEVAAPLFAITPIAAPVRNPDEIARVIGRLEGKPPCGLIVTADYFVSSQRELIVTLAARHRVAAIYPWREIGGGLMSYSLGEPLAPQLAAYVDRILKGAKPAELPVQEPTKFKLINLRTAKALDLDVPPSLLARADEVIE
ncbi:putative ABC transport system substrate-binding protein [Bradyrhizobium sp. Rc2d]|uniref:ABC transporter substrate-binding protein n=1 Tax=Bradyrhizobium sp. Rc2d TaxID=1855321 RepID=UPI00088080B2|nr:ABC transporter substrate-binding protein [Bradyrhizobium sp. Rc2d]SDJ30530.1 putative ABC transport system substrate-binding protein [Bradyrhizobium sp. Rc2d]